MMDAVPLISSEEIVCARDKTTFLGRGGFGEVHRGEWGGASVAIKELLSDALVGTALEEFDKEAITHARLRHPNIVQLFGITRDMRGSAMIMELLDTSLFHFLHHRERDQPMSDKPLSLRLRIGRESLAGLKYLHGQKIIHRDLKTLNILLTEKRQARISDFGLAKLKTTSACVSKGGSVGTPAYMAPELFDRKPIYSVQSDIFALGVVFWELVSREVPFKDADMPVQIMGWIMMGKMDPIPDGTHPALQRAIEGAWAKDPAQRPSLDTIAGLLAEAASAAPAVVLSPPVESVGSAPPETFAAGFASGTAFSEVGKQHSIEQITQKPMQRSAKGTDVPTTKSKVQPNLLEHFRGECVRVLGSEGSQPGQFNLPVRIALCGGEILVTEWSTSRVQMLHKDTGAFLRLLGTGVKGKGEGDLFFPYGIAIAHTKGEVYVSEYGNHRVSVFRLSGEHSHCFGREGSGNGELRNPTGICLSPDETELYVCDRENNRVQVFAAADGTFLRTWGSVGKNEGKLGGVGDVCVSADGTEVYVSEACMFASLDSINHRVSVFSPEGHFLRVLGREGKGDCEFNRPTGLALTGRGTLLVCDSGNHRVQEVRCSDGTCVRKWGRQGERRGELLFPMGIAVGDVGEVYVSDGELWGAKGHRVQVFE